ncbi:unnamed protein product [Pleuronectes platessa]|uniref:Uncharacterized protein n=1 Tax=Pleuronectes platessa TaxID=8262 RepID=A0A9N7Z3F0_PLEPL|nr:unnamed protein product [Pleuronectes platessa]
MACGGRVVCIEEAAFRTVRWVSWQDYQVPTGRQWEVSHRAWELRPIPAHIGREAAYTFNIVSQGQHSQPGTCYEVTVLTTVHSVTSDEYKWVFRPQKLSQGTKNLFRDLKLRFDRKPGTEVGPCVELHFSKPKWLCLLGSYQQPVIRATSVLQQHVSVKECA